MNTTRRRFIKGIAATLALPQLPSLHAGVPRSASALAHSALRMAFVYAPNGVNLTHWLPSDNSNTSRSLAPLAHLRDHYSVIRGLDHNKARANGDGPGDHARANATFLTGAQARKTQGADIRLGVSVDQIGRPQDRPPHAPALARTLDRSAAPQRQLRFRLFLCLSVQPLVARGVHTRARRTRSAPGF